MNYIFQYDDNMTKGKVKNKNIVAVYKWEANDSFPLIKLPKAKNCVSLLHMSRKMIKEVETNNIFSQFCVGYMSSSLSKQNNKF